MKLNNIIDDEEKKGPYQIIICRYISDIINCNIPKVPLLSLDRDNEGSQSVSRQVYGQ
jgi:hypothetical protein